MAHFKYLVVGGGMTGDAAVGGLREVDPQGSVGLLGAEPHAPYNRPPLTKALWKGAPENTVWRTGDRHGVQLMLGRRGVRLDRQARTLLDDRGETHGYEKLLLATGGTPRRLAGGDEGVTYFRTLDDYRALRAAVRPGRRFAVVGGGFIGSELAAALALNGAAVTMLLPEPGLCARVFPRDLSDAVTADYRRRGVQVEAGEPVASVTRGGGGWTVRTVRGREVRADAVVAGLGIVPNAQLAQAAGLLVEDGIVVDGQLRTADPDVFAAGDVARFPAGALGGLRRFEHEDAALSTGRLAGRNMAGAGDLYEHLPMFYSDLFDLGYEAVGDVDARLESTADWLEPMRRGFVYYLQGGKVRGVLCVGVFGKVDEARRLIARGAAVTPASLRGRLQP